MQAIHLQTTDNFTTENCLTAVRRFIARLGSPKLILSDDAAYLVAARKQIMKQPLIINKDEIATKLQLMSIDWRPNIPSAPHFSRARERLVSITKRVFVLNLGSDRLSRDLFSTIVVEREGLINSRPPTHVICDNNDTLPLTPNYFLIGRRLIYAPAASFLDQTNNNKLSNKSWKQTTDRLDSFWKRLLKEYAPTLFKRTKWNQKEETIQKHDLEWILENFTPRGIWTLGKVVECLPVQMALCAHALSQQRSEHLLGPW